MIQESINLGFILVGVYFPSWVTMVYLLSGIYLWLTCTFFLTAARFLYKSILTLSLCVIGVKLLILLLSYSEIIDLKSYTSLCESALDMNPDISLSAFWIAVLPECLAAFFSVLGIFLSIKNWLSWTDKKLFKLSGILALYIGGCIDYTIPSAVYNVFIIYWVTTACLYKQKINSRMILYTSAVLSICQILMPLVPIEIPRYMIGSSSTAPQYFSAILVNIALSALARELNAGMLIGYNAPLLPRTKEFTSKAKLFVLFQYFLSKVCLFLLINQNSGVVSLIYLVWFAFTLLESSLHSNMRVIKFLLIPLQVVSYTYSYVIALWMNKPSEIHYLMLFTILLFCNIYRGSPKLKDIDYKLPATWYGKLISVIISNSYLFSLVTLFIIGLSAINLLHTGLMIICIMFMSNVKSIERHWSLLITYVVFIMLVRNTWRYFQSMLPGVKIDSNMLRIIGIINEQESILLVDYDHLTWILLLCCSLQQFANNYEIGDSLKTYASSWYRVFDIAYSYFATIEIWVIYAFLFIPNYLSEVSVLNLVRAVVLHWTFYKHLASPLRTMNYNFSHLHRELRFLTIYSGFLLAGRYIYQFAPFFFDQEEVDLNFELLGFWVYDHTNLYYRTGSDTTILIASILAERSFINWKRRHDSLGRKLEVTKNNEENTYTKKVWIEYIFFNFFSQPFHYVFLLIVGMLCVFWKISLSMILYLVVCGIYSIRIAYCYITNCRNEFFDMKIVKKSDWMLRAWQWNLLFILSWAFLLLQYMAYLINEDLAGDSQLAFQSVLSFCGFYIDSSIPLHTAIGYYLIFCLLSMERHCLEFNIPESLKSEEHGWILKLPREPTLSKKMSYFDYVSAGLNSKDNPNSDKTLGRLTRIKDHENFDNLSSKINFISGLNLVKMIFEPLIPMFILLLAFYKLSVVSIVYVLSVFVAAFVETTTRTVILNATLSICIWVQYGIALYSINGKYFKQFFEVDTRDQIIWRPLPLGVGSKDDFFAPGIETIQLKSLIFDIIAQILILMYFYYLFHREKQLTILNTKIEYLRRKMETTDKKEASSLTELFKEILFKAKILFYKFARFSILIIVLLFITQSKGLLSAIYCFFCIIFIFNENLILAYKEKPKEPSDINEPFLAKDLTKELKPIHSYIQLLRHFIRLIALDLLLQIAFQVPYIDLLHEPQCPNISSLGCWCSAFGLLRLWTPRYSFIEPEELAIRFHNIWFKIFTFTILLIVQTVMNSNDFKQNHIQECKRIEQQSGVIAEKMAHDFNDQRIFSNEVQLKNKKKFAEKLQKLEEDVEHWNYKFKSIYKTKSRRGSSSNINLGADEDQPKYDLFNEGQKKGLKDSVVEMLIGSINTSLFKDFIERITVISSNLPDSKSTRKRWAEFNMKKNKFYDPQSNYDNVVETKKKTTKKENAKNDKFPISLNQKQYNLIWKDIPLAICYAFASNMLVMVYFLFIFNHFKYASLESLVFPFSILGYAMLEYPRPRMIFFRIMLVYTCLILCIKYTIQQDILKQLSLNLDDYKDPYKLGFNLAANTYSESLFYYVLWDVLVIFAILCHEYYSLRIGMWKKIETDIESIEAALKRLTGQSQAPHIFQLSEVSFFQRLVPTNTIEKPGKDLYLCSFICQLALLIYIFVFFNKLDGFNQDISKAIQSNQFQGKMVVALSIVVLLILYDRYVYLRHTSLSLQDLGEDDIDIKPKNSTPRKSFRKANLAQELAGLSGMGRLIKSLSSKAKRDRDIQKLLVVKLILHIVFMVLVYFFTFWYFPINTNYNLNINRVTCTNIHDKARCNNFEINIFLQFFYIIFTIYLIFESQQIRYGLPSFTNISFPLMRHISSSSSAAFKVYKGTPFLFELRTVMDWTFTNTALNIFQWFKLEDIQAQLFLDQCREAGLKSKKHGSRIRILEKCQYGVMSLILMLLIIMLPLFIFSTLNPITEPNRVTTASLSAKIIIGQRMFKIFSQSTAEVIRDVTPEHFNSRFNASQELRADDWENMQIVNMPRSADVHWDITDPTRYVLKSSLNELKKNATDFYLLVELMLTRKHPVINPTVNIQYKNPLNETHATQLFNMIFEKSDEVITMNGIIFKLIGLPSAGNNIIPYFIEQELYKRNLYLGYVRRKSGNFWNVSSFSWHDKDIGLRFYVISDLYSAVTFNFSILTFYISIVYLAGRLIRNITYGGAFNITITDMQNTERLTTLCNAIYVCRMIGKLKKEEILYYELIDILRSPELTKALTGSSSIKHKMD